MTLARPLPELTVVIPFYNRADTVQFTLESIDRARQGLPIEVLLVDDGSSPPASEQLGGTPHQPDRILRQENQGLLFARLTGLQAAQGEFVLFLDSDDLVGPDKFVAQLRAMRASGASVSYTDTAQAELRTPYDSITPRPDAPVEETTASMEFFIRVQPAPHSPIFRTAWLRQLVATPLFPPAPQYNPVAEIWFYHIAAPCATTVVKTPGPHTIIGHHSGARLTNQWEKLAVASLGVMEAFMRTCPATDQTCKVRQLVGERAFDAWRRLPYDFSDEFDRRLLSLWKCSPRGSITGLGGAWFGRLARLVGPVSAGRIFRRVRGHSYQSCRTLEDFALFTAWMARLPAA